MAKVNARWGASVLVLFVVVYACARLGWWQWERAAEFRAAEKPIVDQPRVPLTEVTSRLINLPTQAEGRLVSAAGTYVRAWTVVDRESGSRSGTWQVGLLDQGDGSGILVVRSWYTDDLPLPDGEVNIDGRLMPSQNPELSASADSNAELSRVDPALVISQTSLDLFDGYIIASGETPSSDALDFVAAPQVRKSPPGFYLQHVAYVVLWWFFGLVAIAVWVRSWLQERGARHGRKQVTSVS